ncbi:DUF6161 domain-containing protein [Sphingomonas sp. ZB1N12]|uniref:DUF6161 domain-containing protein n=1 Tax=Sphingomonas arabinosi TaxID=3096160 RepID=UPI002FCACFBF
MSDMTYVINYRTLPPIERAARQTMVDHLEREQVEWKPFLDKLASEYGDMQIQAARQPMRGRQLATAFDQLRAMLADPDGFGRITANSFRRATVAPPPSGSTEGQLVLGLHAAGRTGDAAAAYARFVALELGTDDGVHRPAEDFAAFLKRGEILLAAGHVAAALPSSKLASSGIRTSKARAQELLAALDGRVAEAAEINADHATHLSNMRDLTAAGIVRVRRTLLRAERARDRRQRAWRADVEAEVQKRFGEAEARLQALDRLGGMQQRSREESFDELKALFHTQLRLRAPVALWEQRSETHRSRAVTAQRLFWLATLFAVLVGIGAPYWFGDYIAGSFHVGGCRAGARPQCVGPFSAKGPLTVAGLLLTSSLILWATRLQYRIFLSERHLSLDAEEKKAFAETFMALKEGASVDTANETIVLASLFRPTQDGIIKDEPGGFDLSAAAVLAKQMAR